MSEKINITQNLNQLSDNDYIKFNDKLYIDFF